MIALTHPFGYPFDRLRAAAQDRPRPSGAPSLSRDREREGVRGRDRAGGELSLSILLKCSIMSVELCYLEWRVRDEHIEKHQGVNADT